MLDFQIKITGANWRTSGQIALRWPLRRPPQSRRSSQRQLMRRARQQQQQQQPEVRVNSCLMPGKAIVMQSQLFVYILAYLLTGTETRAYWCKSCAIVATSSPIAKARITAWKWLHQMEVEVQTWPIMPKVAAMALVSLCQSVHRRAVPLPDPLHQGIFL